MLDEYLYDGEQMLLSALHDERYFIEKLPRHLTVHISPIVLGLSLLSKWHTERASIKAHRRKAVLDCLLGHLHWLCLMIVAHELYKTRQLNQITFSHLVRVKLNLLSVDLLLLAVKHSTLAGKLQT